MYNVNNAALGQSRNWIGIFAHLDHILMVFHFCKCYFLSECATPSSYRVSDIISVLRQSVIKLYKHFWSHISIGRFRGELRGPRPPLFLWNFALFVSEKKKVSRVELVIVPQPLSAFSGSVSDERILGGRRGSRSSPPDPPSGFAAVTYILSNFQRWLNWIF